MKQYSNFEKYFITPLPTKPGFGKNKGSVIDWPNTVGKTFSIYYNEKKYVLLVNSYNKNTQTLNITFLDIDKTTGLHTNTVKHLRFADILTPNRCEDFEYNIGDLICSNKRNLKILDRKYLEKNNHFIKEYTYLCLDCNNKGTHTEKELKAGSLCSVCSHSTVVIGINDIATTHPELVPFFCDKSDTIKNSYGTNKKFDVKCPNCNYIKHMRPMDILRAGFGCPKCGDGKSYPAKFLIAFFDQLNEYYKPEYYPDWIKDELNCKKFYDLYIPSRNMIIEIHGPQHYKDINGFFRAVAEESANDILKENLAKKNGISEYISISAKQSTAEYLSNSIINSKLSEIYDLTNINWDDCDRAACSSLIKKACELWENGLGIKAICEQLNLGRKTVREYLKHGAELDWCNYTTKNHMKESAKRTPRSKLYKPVICLETNKQFPSIKHAAEATNANSVEIGKCCKGLANTSGGYHWRFA